MVFDRCYIAFCRVVFFYISSIVHDDIVYLSEADGLKNIVEMMKKNKSFFMISKIPTEKNLLGFYRYKVFLK